MVRAAIRDSDFIDWRWTPCCTWTREPYESYIRPAFVGRRQNRMKGLNNIDCISPMTSYPLFHRIYMMSWTGKLICSNLNENRTSLPSYRNWGRRPISIHLSSISCIRATSQDQTQNHRKYKELILERVPICINLPFNHAYILSTNEAPLEFIEKS